MNTIYKYQLGTLNDEFDMPKGAEILTVQEQNNELMLWAVVDVQEQQIERRKFGVYGTGHNMPSDIGKYIGSVQLNGGALVLHVFDQSNAKITGSEAVKVD